MTLYNKQCNQQIHFKTSTYQEKKHRYDSFRTMRTAPLPTESPKQKSDNTKTSTTQRLGSDLGWSVGVTTAIKMVWSNRFTGSKPSHLVLMQQIVV